MNNRQAEQSVINAQISTADEFDTLKPSERFARLAKTVFGVKKAELDAHLKDHPLPKLKAGRKPKNG